MMILVAVTEDTSETHMYPMPATTRSRRFIATTHQAQTMPTTARMTLDGRDDPSTKMCAVPPPSAVTTHTTMLLTEALVLVGPDTTRRNVSDTELLWLKVILISLRLPSLQIRFRFFTKSLFAPPQTSQVVQRPSPGCPRPRGLHCF